MDNETVIVEPDKTPNLLQFNVDNGDDKKKKTKNPNSIDFTFFNSKNAFNDGVGCNIDIKASECVHVKRLISSLKYLSRMDVINNLNDRNIFLNFIDSVYGDSILVNDYTHFISNHKESFIEIVEDLYNDKESKIN